MNKGVIPPLQRQRRMRTDREISAALHTALAEQSAALRRLASHAPMAYIAGLLDKAATLVDTANTAWNEEEERAGVALWRCFKK